MQIPIITRAIISDKKKSQLFYVDKDILVHIQIQMVILGGVCVRDGLGATKSRLFGKKSGGTPNPQVKKVGVTPNSDQIFASAAARRGSGRQRQAEAEAKI